MSNYLHSIRRRRDKRLAQTYAQRDSGDQRIAVIGLGRFGSSLAEELMRRGWEVLGVDEDERIVQQHADALTHAAVADCTDNEVVRQLGVHEFPSAVVAIGTDIEASILVTSNLLEDGVPNIWAKAISRQHGKILERLGAHHVVLPEHEMGERVAHLVTGRMLDFIEFDDDFALAKTVAPDVATGVPLGVSAVRTKHGVTVVGIKRPGQDFTHATAETVVEPGDVIIITGKTQAVEAFTDLG
ncbi:potassium channel family protein [Streptomyces sp. NBC_01803]|uniref:potassium channel family protein n=1 Tax=Streptomyces sp. NBC_01803 TaxID=2975946 RepID=UPI002DD954EB|nr:TrkA family potassium uptake protein [Streptomyces sp. NBC_01803]WSA46122.1 TrkA family potassium uptake protein [Streptomyces sp. NBC_01803]